MTSKAVLPFWKIEKKIYETKISIAIVKNVEKSENSNKECKSVLPLINKFFRKWKKKSNSSPTILRFVS